MDREEIVRSEFPTTRKGWDPDAVRAHLEGLADRLPRASSSLGDLAAERVGEIVAAAEATAARIDEEARERAEATLAAAQEQAESLLSAARNDAQQRVERAQQAVENLVGQAEELRSRVGSLGDSLAGAPPVQREDADAAASEPERDALESEPAPEPEPVAKQPEPEPVATSGEGDTSTDDLIAKLKNGGAAAAADAAPPEGGSDGAAARLVAMKLALEGADREAIAARLRSEFGSAGDDGALLDDVLSRAGRG